MDDLKNVELERRESFLEICSELRARIDRVFYPKCIWILDLILKVLTLLKRYGTK